MSLSAHYLVSLDFYFLHNLRWSDVQDSPNSVLVYLVRKKKGIFENSEESIEEVQNRVQIRVA